MAKNIASKESPMKFGERQRLQQLRITFYVPPYEFLYTPSLADVMSTQKICTFVDNLLKELIDSNPTTISPQPSAWKLIKDNAELDLKTWEPCNLEPDTTITIASSNTQIRLPVICSSPTTIDKSWVWSERVLTVRFPDQYTFLLEHHDLILVILRCQTRHKAHKKWVICETNHTIFIPVTYTVQNVLGLIQFSNVSAVFSDDQEDNLRLSGLTASELSWKHGTTLRLELW